jgi:hypothetical protein
MKVYTYLLIAYILSFSVIISQAQNTSSEAASGGELMPFLNADFFADSIAEAYTLEEDPMGEQRLLQVRNSSLAPSVVLSSSYNYSSNPEKVANPTKKDGTTLNLSLTFNLGLGEYSLGDEVILAPSLMYMRSRTFTDPFKDFGDDMRNAFDVDMQLAQLEFPFALPNDFYLKLGHTYAAPSKFRKNEQNEKFIAYTNTPSIQLIKNFTLNNGDKITFTSGFGYNFSNSDTLLETQTPQMAAFLEEVFRVNGKTASAEFPADLASGFVHSLNISYSSTINEKLIFAPYLSYSSTSFTKGDNKSRVDKVYNLGVSSTYFVGDWLSFTSTLNHTWNRSNHINSPELEDLNGGLGVSINHSF